MNPRLKYAKNTYVNYGIIFTDYGRKGGSINNICDGF